MRRSQVRVPSPAPRRSKLYIACSDFLCKNQSLLMPPLLLYRKRHARLNCSLVSALATFCCHYHLFAQKALSAQSISKRFTSSFFMAFNIISLFFPKPHMPFRPLCPCLCWALLRKRRGLRQKSVISTMHMITVIFCGIFKNSSSSTGPRTYINPQPPRPKTISPSRHIRPCRFKR